MKGPKSLRKWRGERTLRLAGDLLGCDPSYVSYLEKGQRTPPLALALHIARVAKIPVEDWVELGASSPGHAA